MKLPRKVHAKHGALYWVHRNRWHRLCPTDATESELRQAIARAQGSAQPKTVAELFALYREALPDLAPRTRKDYAIALSAGKPLHRVFGAMALKTVRSIHVAQYLEARRRNGSPVAGNRERAVLSSAFAWGMRQGYCEQNPCVGVRRNKESPRTRYIGDAELLALLNVSSEAMQDAIGIAYLTGMRRGDLLALTKAAVQKDGLHWMEGKRRVARVVLWSDALLFFVKRAMARSKCDALLTRTGEAPWSSDGFTGGWRRAMERASLAGFTFHDLRAKAGSDHKDGRGLLAHGSQALFLRVYKRKAGAVLPVR